MKQSLNNKNKSSQGTGTTINQQSLKSPKNTPQQSNQDFKYKENNKSRYKVVMLSKDNFDILSKKNTINQIPEINLKYVLKCIQGIYKNRFLFISTNQQGQVFGSGQAKLYGLTLQIQGANLDPKHAQLRFDGFKGFFVQDFDTETGTWLNISQKGIQLRENSAFTIGNHSVTFTFGQDIRQIEEICQIYGITYLSDILEYNSIKTLGQLYKANQKNYEGYPLQKKQKEKLKKICQQSSQWYIQGKKYRNLNMKYHNQPLKGLQIQIGWKQYLIPSDPQAIFTGINSIARVHNYKLMPSIQIFTKVPPKTEFPLNLHNQIKIGQLSFELCRYNSGWDQDIGFRQVMEDGLFVQQDIGGSQTKLISLFGVMDGHGGSQCQQFIKQNIVAKIRNWAKRLDSSQNINQDIKNFMTKTFMEIDYQFFKKYTDISLTCGTTLLVMLIVGGRVYVFSVGDCKGYLLRKNTIYQLNIEHKPTIPEQKIRIQKAGGYVQYDRLMAKCTLSRCMGQFEYKNRQDYQQQVPATAKSYLSCIPDAISFDLNAQTDEFIFLTTDGILQTMSIDMIAQYIRGKYEKLEQEENPNKIIKGIMQKCKVAKSTCDNMAAILIILKKGSYQKTNNGPGNV